MNNKRRAARNIVGTVRVVTTISATLVVGAARLCVEIAEQAVKAADALGEDLEKKLEEDHGQA